MAQECAFFNAELSGEEYDRVYLAETFAAYFASFIGNGVYYNSLEELGVLDQDTPNMTVQVLPGQAWINGYWYRNTAAYTLPISIADGTLDRIDRIILRWDQEKRDMYLMVLKGTASRNPTAPDITRNSDYYDLVLANITVAAGATTITQSAIEDVRADSTVCGWVTGVVEQIDLTNLYTQWSTFFNEQKVLYTNWIDGIQSDYNTWIANFEKAANTWFSTQQDEFEEWVETLRDILDEETAGHLQNEIEALQASDAEHEEYLDLIAKMLIENHITAVTELSDGSWLELSDGSLLAFQWSYEVYNPLQEEEDPGGGGEDPGGDDYLPLSGGDLTGDVSVNLSGDANKPYIKTDYANGALHINSKQGAHTNYKIGKVERTVSGNTYEQNYPNKSGTFAIIDEDDNIDLTTRNTIEGGMCNVAEGQMNTIGDVAFYPYYSHVEGYNNTVLANAAHAEGQNNTATGDNAHAEGRQNSASGIYSHAEGYSTTASGTVSHAEGQASEASGNYSHAEGGATTASGQCSHAQNNHTVAGYANQTAMGTYNNNKSTNLLEVGNGADDNNHSNAMEVTADGDLLIKNGGVSLYGLDENKEVLGSKNLLPLTLDNLKAINTSGQWSDNVYTNSDGTVEVLTDSVDNVIGFNVNGTFTSTIWFALANFTLKAGTYILNGGAVSNIGLYGQAETPFAGWESTESKPESQKEFNSDATGRIFIRLSPVQYSNTKVYPMIRLASDPNPTYRPYAMSNQELTQRLLALEARVTALENA